MRVPGPEFETINVWAEAFAPAVHELVSNVGETAMVGVGERTVRVTGIVCGLFCEPCAVIVILAE